MLASYQNKKRVLVKPLMIFSTTIHEMDIEALMPIDSEAPQTSTDLCSPTKLVIIEASTTIHQVSGIVHQNDQDTIESEHQNRESKKRTNPKPLKVLVKRYSTKKYNRHHVEEVKVKVYSDESSSSSDEDNAAANSTE